MLCNCRKKPNGFSPSKASLSESLLPEPRNVFSTLSSLFPDDRLKKPCGSKTLEKHSSQSPNKNSVSPVIKSLRKQLSSPSRIRTPKKQGKTMKKRQRSLDCYFSPKKSNIVPDNSKKNAALSFFKPFICEKSFNKKHVSNNIIDLTNSKSETKMVNDIKSNTSAPPNSPQLLSSISQSQEIAVPSALSQHSNLKESQASTNNSNNDLQETSSIDFGDDSCDMNKLFNIDSDQQNTLLTDVDEEDDLPAFRIDLTASGPAKTVSKDVEIIDMTSIWNSPFQTKIDESWKQSEEIEVSTVASITVFCQLAIGVVDSNFHYSLMLSSYVDFNVLIYERLVITKQPVILNPICILTFAR